MFHDVSRYCLPVASNVCPLLSNSLPLVSQMCSPRCALPGVVSQVLSPCPVFVYLSSTCLPGVVSQLSPTYGFRNVVSHSCCCLVVFHLSPGQMWPPSCLPDVVAQMLSPSCFQGFFMCCLVVFHVSPRCGSNSLPIALEAFQDSHLFPRIGLPNISTCLPFVALLFPSCLSNVVSRLPPSCLELVLQM